MRKTSLLPLAGLALLFACSGAANTDLFAGSSGTSGTSDTPPVSTTEPTSPEDPGTDPNGGGGGGGGGGGTKDASTTTTPDAGHDSATTVDAGPGRSVYCGGRSSGTPVYCNATQMCCGAKDQGGTMTYQCQPQLSVCTGIPIECNDKSDCPFNQVCCGAYDGNTGYKAVTCAPTCQGNGPGGVQLIRICDLDAPIDECAPSQKCTASAGLPGYGRCGAL